MLAEQIKAARDEGCCAADIALGLNVSETVVKSVLEDEDFSDHDLAVAKDAIRLTAAQGENERNRLQAAMFIFEVKRGHRVPKAQEAAINIQQIQQLIIRSNHDIAQFVSRNRCGDQRIIEATELPQADHQAAPDAIQAAGTTGEDASTGSPGAPSPEPITAPAPRPKPQYII